MNIGVWIMIIVGGTAGVLSTLYLFLSMPVILVWKIYRKFRYHISLYD